jgi:hypothetical protein
MTKFDSVVVKVADSEDKNAETTSGASTMAYGAVRGYKPITGGSFASISLLTYKLSVKIFQKIHQIPTDLKTEYS